MRPLLAALALLGLLPVLLLADVGPPAHMQVREREPGLYRVEWRVPKALPPRAVPTPVLPQSCRAVSDRQVTDQPTAWIFTRDWQCDGSVAGQPLGIRYPFADLALTTVIRVDLLTGDRFAHVRSPGEGPWLVPEGTAPPDPVATARRAVLAGAGHTATSWIHVLLAVALALVGSSVLSRPSPAGVSTLPVRLVMLFTVGQLVGVLLSKVSGIEIPSPASELGVALGAVLVAREALSPPRDRKSLSALLLAIGFAHGLGLAAMLAPNLGSETGIGSLVVATVGVDAAHLLAVGAFLWLVQLLGGREANRPWTVAAAYGSGAASMAMAMALAFGSQATGGVSADTGVLPGQIAAGGTPSRMPSSQRLTSSNPDAPVQSFLAVEPFEVRHEVMLRLGGLTEALGLAADQVVPVEAQPALVDSLVGWVLGGARVIVEGAPATPSVRRADFMTVDPTGALPRPSAVPEPVSEAVVGIVAVYPTGGVPNRVTLQWEWFPAPAAGVPVTTVDPENTSSALLTPDGPSVRWENRLVEDPVPSVEAVLIEPTRLPVPILTLPLLVLAAMALTLGLRGAWPALTTSAARLALAAAFLVGPVLQTAVAVPGSAGSVPSERQARRILSGLLPNVYRALEFRQEAAVYDRLAVSVTGATLTDVYLEQRRALELEERGGAQARVETVEVLDANDIRSDEKGFSVRAAWTVGGMVTHFGHRHFRQNRYHARVAVDPVEGAWKIRSMDVLEQERVR